jgi:hypothetical protein
MDCPDCGTTLVDTTTFGTPEGKRELICGCAGRTWTLDTRTGNVTDSEENLPTA